MSTVIRWSILKIDPRTITKMFKFVISDNMSTAIRLPGLNTWLRGRDRTCQGRRPSVPIVPGEVSTTMGKMFVGSERAISRSCRRLSGRIYTRSKWPSDHQLPGKNADDGQTRNAGSRTSETSFLFPCRTF